MAGNEFDFEQHANTAVVSYLKERQFYDELASVVRRIVEEALERQSIKVHSVQSRAKDATSFVKKARQPSELDLTKAKYDNPLNQITDLAGVRIIAYFPDTLVDIDKVLNEEFQIIEKTNKGDDLIEEDKFGYQSIHYLVQLTEKRIELPEYRRFKKAITEVQARTILQHAWAEIEHDIQYKASSVIPTAIRRRFMALAGLFEIADREFQAIQNADRQLTDEVRTSVEAGQLDNIEITSNSLKTFLDQKIGSDGRMGEYSYDWTARLLKRLGFRTLEQVEKCIDGFDDDRLSRIASGVRQGQISRFEYMLLAGMGETYLQRHIFAPQIWWVSERNAFEKFKAAAIPIKNYDPMNDLPSPKENF